MLKDFEVAEYALKRAIDMLMDADMKGPCQCSVYMEQMQIAIDAAKKAVIAVHMWDGKKVME